MSFPRQRVVLVPRFAATAGVMSMSLVSRSSGNHSRKLSRALSPVVESLEGRMLLHAGHLHVNVNFQPAASAVPSGYLVDSGQVFGLRSNGATYGWDLDNTTSTRDRNKLVDQRYD